MKTPYIIFVQILALWNLMQAQSSDFIFWQEDVKLTWDDFRAEPPMQSPYEAMTASGIQYGYQATNRNGKLSFTFQVRSYFNPNTSWVKPSSRNEHLLAHEQIHFDISEHHARLLARKLNEHNFSANYKEEIDEIYQSIIDQRSKMQDQYDHETDHSRNADVQLEWIKKLESLIRN